MLKKKSLTTKLVYSVLCSFAVMFCFAGCGQHDYKAEADETVYTIIDEKWEADFGSKANYKISDTQASPDDIDAQTAVPVSGIVSLPRAISIATAHNRQYQTEKELLYNSALDLRLARHVFEPNPFGGGRGGYSKDGDDESVGVAGNLGFDQLLASGARISTNLTVAWAEILTGNMNSGLTSIASAVITQPLLRGSNSEIVLENLTQAERDTVYQIRSFNRFRQTFVVSVASQYYFVLKQFDFLKNAENNLNILTEIHDQTEILVDAGRLPRYELDRVAQDKLDAKDIYIQLQRDYKQALDEFKITLSLPTTAEFTLDENELSALTIVSNPDLAKEREKANKTLITEALDLLEEELEATAFIEPEREDTDFSDDDVIQTAFLLRLDLANRADEIYDAERKVLVAADNLRAGLNLVAGGDFSSQGSSDSAAGVGLELDLPLDRLAEANVYRKALITLTQSQRDYDESADLVVLEVRRAYRDFTKAAKQHSVQTEGLRLAQKRYDKTLLLMRYGRANSRRVLDAQDDLFKAQNSATEALVGHTVAMLDFYRDAGVLQVRPDGMWEY